MQGFVCVLLCLWLGLAVGQNETNVTTTPATFAPEQTTRPTEESKATLAPELPTRATIAPPYIDICTRQGYNITTLSQAPHWKFAVHDKAQCIVPLGNTTANVQSCTVNFAVCHPIDNQTLCRGENGAICQEVILNGGARLYYNMGAYDPKHSYICLLYTSDAADE